MKADKERHPADVNPKLDLLLKNMGGSTNINNKVGDYSLKIHKSAYHFILVFISKRGFSSPKTRKSFGEILSGNHCFLRPSIRLVTPYNIA